MKRKRGPKPDDRPGELRHLVVKATEDELDKLYSLIPRNSRDRAEYLLQALTEYKKLISSN